MRSIRLAAILLIAPLSLAPLTGARAQIGLTVGVGIAITIAPPVLFVYAQPPMPELGTIWTPGYWAYGGDGYYWVPGTWVLPPAAGLYWTPPYWGFESGSYLFHAGYWGPEVGYYGGINYGFGYGGVGYQGGEWHGRDFAYNRNANNFGAVRVTNFYERPIGEGFSGGRPSYNGPGGNGARPNAQEEQAGRAGHREPTALQTQHFQAASQNRDLRDSVNHGQPPIAATGRPGELNGAAGRQGVPLHEGSPARPTMAPHETAPGRTQQPQREAAPSHQAPPQREAAPAHQAPPQREAAPSHQAPPQREAAPSHQAPPQREAAPSHQAPPQREAAPYHQAPPQREAAPQRQAAPAQHAAPHEAPHEEDHR